ncbi:hypothetical protein D3C84_1074840 [compost metagenome]
MGVEHVDHGVVAVDKSLDVGGDRLGIRYHIDGDGPRLGDGDGHPGDHLGDGVALGFVLDTGVLAAVPDHGILRLA